MKTIIKNIMGIGPQQSKGYFFLLFFGAWFFLSFQIGFAQSQHAVETQTYASGTETVTADLTINPYQVTKGGQVLITWNSVGAVGGCRVRKDGSNWKTGITGSEYATNINSDTEFTLTCTGSRSSRTAEVSLEAKVLPKVDLYITVDGTDYGLSKTDSFFALVPGTDYRIKWQTEDAASCIGTSFSTSGARNNTTGIAKRADTSIPLTTYTLTCGGAGGTTVIDNVTIQASLATHIGVQSRTFESTSSFVSGSTTTTTKAILTVQPLIVSFGEKSLITWNSNNASSCNVKQDGINWAAGTSGSKETEGLEIDTTYILSCDGPNSLNAEAALTVKVLPRVDLYLTKGSVDYAVGQIGATITLPTGTEYLLKWQSTPNTISCIPTAFATGGVLNNTTGLSQTAAAPGALYTLTCQGPEGDTVNDSVAVNADASDESSQQSSSTFTQTYYESGNPIANTTAVLIVDPHTVAYDGQSLITWRSEGANACTLQKAGVNWKSGLSGSDSATHLTSNTDFTLTCNGPHALVASVTLTVKVLPSVDLYFTAETQDYGLNRKNSISLITSGTMYKLKWQSSGDATSCVGSGFDTGGAADNTAGIDKTAAIAEPMTTYILTCTGSGGSSSDRVTVNVSDAVVPNPHYVSACSLDIALALDNSGSISAAELLQMKSAVKSFVDKMPSTVQFSVTSFDRTATKRIGFTDNRDAIYEAIDSIPAWTSGVPHGTNWQDGLIKAWSTYDPRSNAPNLIIFASDGVPTIDNVSGEGTKFDKKYAMSARDVANEIKTAGTRIVTVGIGVDSLALENLAMLSGSVINSGDVKSDVISTNFDDMADDMSALVTNTSCDLEFNLEAAAQDCTVVGHAKKGSIQLTWDKLSTADAYYLYRTSNISNERILVGQPSASGRIGFLDSNLEVGVVYGYQISALIAGGGETQKSPNPKIYAFVNDNCAIPEFRASCTASPNPAALNQSVTWTAHAEGGVGGYSYVWSGAVSGSGASKTDSYDSPGTRHATLLAISGGDSATGECQVTVPPGGGTSHCNFPEGPDDHVENYVAPRAGCLKVDTDGSDFDTGLAVYTTDPSSGQKVLVACNNDCGADKVDSATVFETAAGTQYEVHVVNVAGDNLGTVQVHYSVDDKNCKETPTCGSGEVLSNGHCCPIGQSWNGTSCLAGNVLTMIPVLEATTSTNQANIKMTSLATGERLFLTAAAKYEENERGWCRDTMQSYLPPQIQAAMQTYWNGNYGDTDNLNAGCLGYVVTTDTSFPVLPNTTYPDKTKPNEIQAAEFDGTQGLVIADPGNGQDVRFSVTNKKICGARSKFGIRNTFYAEEAYIGLPGTSPNFPSSATDQPHHTQTSDYERQFFKWFPVDVSGSRGVQVKYGFQEQENSGSRWDSTVEIEGFCAEVCGESNWEKERSLFINYPDRPRYFDYDDEYFDVYYCKS